MRVVIRFRQGFNRSTAFPTRAQARGSRLLILRTLYWGPVSSYAFKHMHAPSRLVALANGGVTPSPKLNDGDVPLESPDPYP